MSNKFEVLHPILQTKFKKLEYLSLDKFNIKIRITQTLRTEAEQYAYWCKGRLPLPDVNGAMLKAGLPIISPAENVIVTKAKSASSSFHGYGLAFDICIELADGKHVTFDDNADTNGDGIPDWDQVGGLAEECGLEWGGNFSSIPDKPHFQDRLGWTIAQLVAAKIPSGQTYIGLPYNATTTIGPRQ